MEKERIFWFNDGLCLNSPPQNWGGIHAWSQNLITQVDDGNRLHKIVNPLGTIEGVLEFVEKMHPTVVVDLTGSLENVLENFLPASKILSNFHISRIRKVNSPRLDGVGFLLSHSPREMQARSDDFDFSGPLLIDDVVWSGRTILVASDTLNLSRQNTSIATFCMNKGNFGRNPGAFDILGSKGFKRIFCGVDVFTPEDDGFHTKDLIKPNVIFNPDVFETIIRIQELREQDEVLKEQDHIELETCLEILTQNQAISPDSVFTSEELKKLIAEDKMVAPGGVPKNSLFVVNPTAWLMPSLSKRLTANVLRRNKDAIIASASMLSDLSENNEIVRENVTEIQAERQSRGAERS